MGKFIIYEVQEATVWRQFAYEVEAENREEVRRIYEEDCPTLPVPEDCGDMGGEELGDIVGFHIAEKGAKMPHDGFHMAAKVFPGRWPEGQP